MLKSLTLIVAVVGAYFLLRGWLGAPGFLLRSCFAVAILVAGLAFWGGRRDPDQAKFVCMRRAGWMDYLSLGAAVVFAEVFCVLFAGFAAGPSQDVADGAVTLFHEVVLDESEVNDGGSESGEAGGHAGDVDFDASGEGSGNWLFKPSLERNLPQRSNHQPGNKPQIFIKLDRAEDAEHLLRSRIHFRSFAFSRFDGVSWSAMAVTRRKLVSPVTFETLERPGHSAETLGFQGPVLKYRVYQGVNPTGQNVLSALHGAVGSDIESLTQLGEAIYLLPKLANEKDGYDYEVSSRPVHFTDLINRPLAPAPAEAEQLRIPDLLSVRLNQMADPLRAEPDLAAQLVALRSFLQDHYSYSLETANVDNGNPLENFLYTEKRGYCEHFATAAAMFCRALGVPSRIAYGWSGGRLYRSQNMFVFRAKDAHAWTEIKLKGYGWVVFDTTPPDHDATPEAQSAPDSEPVPDPQDVLAEQYRHDQEQRAELAPDARLAFEVNTRPLMIALGLVAFCCIAFLIMRIYWGPKTEGEGCSISSPPAAYLLQFKQVCAAMAHPMPVGRTMRQQIELLRTVKNPPDFLDDLLDYHYGVLYGEWEKDKAREKSLIQAMDQWRKASNTELA